jgi:hypothetical protein
MSSFTGLWVLNNEQCRGQKELLTAMSRKSWQIKLIESARETLLLRHYVREENGKPLRVFRKDVHIYLESKVLNVMSKLFRIPFDQVRYDCTMVADTKEAHHPDDAKQFGDCTSRTSWVDKNEKSQFVIRWYLKQGLLKVQHALRGDDQLVAQLSFTDRTGKTTTSLKVYDRAPFRPEDLALLRADPEQATRLEPQKSTLDVPVNTVDQKT